MARLVLTLPAEEMVKAGERGAAGMRPPADKTRQTKPERGMEMNTKKTTRFCVRSGLSLLLLLFVYGGTALADPAGHPQRLCPVLGGEIDPSAYVDYEGKRVYFCCAGCKETFLRAPDKYMKDMETEGVVLESSPSPKSGKKHGRMDGRDAHHVGMGSGHHGMHGGTMR